jgi:hypothetical protein
MHQHGKIKMCFFIVHDIFINSNEIKFEIDIKNDELLKIIHGNIFKNKKYLIIITHSVKQCRAQVHYMLCIKEI